MGGLFSTPPPFVQRLVCLLTWAVALGLGLPQLFDEARHDSTEIGLVWLRRFLPRGVDLAELFRYRLLIGTVVWFCVYASSCLALKKLGGRMLKDVRGFPLFSYMVSFQHAVTLSCLVAGAYAVAPGHRIDVNAPFVGAPHSWLLEQVLCACAGYLLKDFYIFEVGIDIPYMLHHGAAVVGGALTFHFPLCASLIALDGYQSEVGSAIYNWACVSHPRGFVARVWYPLTMSASNITIACIAVHVWMQPMALHFRLAFAILSFLIFALRTGGLIVFMTSADTPKDEATSEKTD